MIDKLCLTIHRQPSYSFLDCYGETIEAKSRKQIYKYMCKLEKAVVFYKPHRFSRELNEKLAYTKIDLNPKYFACFNEMWAYLDQVFRGEESEAEIEASAFNISRIDIAADLENIGTDQVLGSLKVRNIRANSLNIFKGTVYAGSDPKVRIYDKCAEIRKRLRDGDTVTEYEKTLVDSAKEHMRFEIQIRSVNRNLAQLRNAPEVLESYFDRLEFFDFGQDGNAGIAHFLLNKINRKYRQALEEFRDKNLLVCIKNKYREGAQRWFSSAIEPF